MCPGLCYYIWARSAAGATSRMNAKHEIRQSSAGSFRV